MQTYCCGHFKQMATTKEKPWTSALQQKTPQLDSSIDTFVNLIDSIEQPQSIHKIETTLFSIPLPKLRELSALSSWKEMIKGQIEEHISKLKQNLEQPTGKVLHCKMLM